MKISPVVGTPTLPNTSNTGLGPEKLARLKAIAAGKPQGYTDKTLQIDDELSDIASRDSAPRGPTPRTITMRTNRTVHRDGLPGPVSQLAEQTLQTESDSAISDPNVQANATAEVTQPLSPQLAMIAKQRRALQVKERELADKEKALGGSTRAELEARIKSQPLSVLQELGVTYDQLTNDILQAQGSINPDIQSLKAELKALKEGVDKTLSDKDAAAEKAVLAEMRRNINQLASQGDDYEAIRETKSESDVIELIHRTYKDTGEVMDEAEAMKLVEEYLIEKSLRLAKLKKVQGKLTPEVPAQQAPQTGMRTLTNKDSAKPMLDRRQRAIQAMLGTLKR